jgi:hypothetical protein
MSEEQHIYHHAQQVEMRVNATVEKNSKGYNYSVTVVNASCTEEAMDAINATMYDLAEQYGAEEMTAKIAKLEAKVDELQYLIDVYKARENGEDNREPDVKEE